VRPIPVPPRSGYANHRVTDAAAARLLLKLADEA